MYPVYLSKTFFKYKIYFILTVFVLVTNCAPQRMTTTLDSCNYDEKKNQTEYMVFPIGSVSIPEKWEKSNYNSVSRQQFFINKDSVTIAIAFSPCNKYEFNIDNSKTGFEFLKSFYNWEREYYTKDLGLHEECVERDSLNNCIIFRVFGTHNNDSIDNVFLFTEKNCNVGNFSVLNTVKWTTNQKIDFLKKLRKSE